MGGWWGSGVVVSGSAAVAGTSVRRTSVRPGGWGSRALGRAGVAFGVASSPCGSTLRGDPRAGGGPRAASSGLDSRPRAGGDPILGARDYVMTKFPGGIGAIRTGSGLLGDPRSRCFRSRAVERPRARASGSGPSSGLDQNGGDLDLERRALEHGPTISSGWGRVGRASGRGPISSIRGRGYFSGGGVVGVGSIRLWGFSSG